MMRIQLTTSRVGRTCNDSAGDVVDVPDEEARRLIATGQAIAAEPPVESNTIQPPQELARPAAGGEVETGMVSPAGEVAGARRNPRARNR